MVSFDVPGVHYADILLFSRGQELTLEATSGTGTNEVVELLSVVRLPEEYNVSESEAVLSAGRLTVTAPRTRQRVRIIEVGYVA